MKLEFLDEFVLKLKQQIDFIATDKPLAAKKLKDDLLEQLKNIQQFPFKHRKSIYFNDEHIRDFIYRGYTIVYKVDVTKQKIIVLGMKKQEKSL